MSVLFYSLDSLNKTLADFDAANTWKKEDPMAETRSEVKELEELIVTLKAKVL